MRRCGGGDRNQIRIALDEAIARNEITMDDISIYRHMAIHAGVVKPTELERYRVCPICEATLDVPEGDEAA